MKGVIEGTIAGVLTAILIGLATWMSGYLDKAIQALDFASHTRIALLDSACEDNIYSRARRKARIGTNANDIMGMIVTDRSDVQVKFFKVADVSERYEADICSWRPDILLVHRSAMETCEGDDNEDSLARIIEFLASERCSRPQVLMYSRASKILDGFADRNSLSPSARDRFTTIHIPYSDEPFLNKDVVKRLRNKLETLLRRVEA
jgi:hypothetical protein